MTSADAGHLDAQLRSYVRDCERANAWLDRVEKAMAEGIVGPDEHLRAAESAIRTRAALRRFLLDHGWRLPTDLVATLPVDEALVDEANGALGG